MNSQNILSAIKHDSRKEFLSFLQCDPLVLDSKIENLNIYQVACILGSVSILSYLDQEGYGFLRDELDDVPFFFFF